MSCWHTAVCPLFPHLRSSLRGWRDHYCDSEQGWRDCARYKMSLTGEPVPIALLPNGRTAMYIDFDVPEAAAPGGVPELAAGAAGSGEAGTSAAANLPSVPPTSDPSSPASRGLLARLSEWLKGSV